MDSTNSIQEVSSKGFTCTLPVRKIGPGVYALEANSKSLVGLKKHWVAISQLNVLLRIKLHLLAADPMSDGLRCEFMQLRSKIKESFSGMQDVGKE